MQKRWWFYLGWLTLMTGLLSACQLVSRIPGQLGVAPHYTIDRWHKNPLSRSARILVVTRCDNVDVRTAVSDLVANKLGNYFEATGIFDPGQSTSSINYYAIRHGFSFIAIVDIKNLNEMEKKKDTPAEGDAGAQFHLVDALINLRDVARNVSIDKIRLHVVARRVPPGSLLIDELMGDALDALGRELSGT